MIYCLPIRFQKGLSTLFWEGTTIMYCLSLECSNVPQYSLKTINGIPVLRSGSDFRYLSYIEARGSPSNKWTFTIQERKIDSTIPEDPTTKEVVSTISAAQEKKLDKPIGYTSVDLDARFDVQPHYPF
jgi:2',3'-cyclic-nucleotide 2'-phosphodiesterase (5'-nucleotidase family)